MRLTAFLMFYVRRRRIPGKITIGKHRIKPVITPYMKEKAAKQLVLQDRNMKVIAQSFLTEEEEKVHMQQDKYVEREQDEKEQKIQDKMFKHRFTVDHLSHLEAARKWE